MSNIVTSLAARTDAVADAYIRKRYAVLFYSLLLYLCSFSAAGGSAMEINLHRVAAGCDPSDSRASAPNRQRAVDSLDLVALAVAGRLFSASFGLNFSSLNLGIFTLVGLLAAVNALRFTLRATSIDSAHIYAALSAYLLAGISFGILYWVVEHAWPGSMYYGGANVGGFTTADGLYFSFVTLATLGYGDFVPKTEVARGLAILEAVAGQLYLAVMVARLVSLYVSGSSSKKESES